MELATLGKKAVGQLREMWQWYQSVKNLIKPQFRRRNVGVGSGGNRKAYCKTAAGIGNTIVCYLGSDSHNADDEITVTYELIGTDDLNSVTPRLKDGTMVIVWNDNGTWRPYFPFQKTGPC